jgi:dynein heavy chain
MVTAFRHLDAGGKKAIDTGDLRNLFFGDYMGPEDANDRPYEEVQDLGLLSARMEQYLADFNAQSRKPMNLVMFMFAIEHISRIARVLKMPGGNALLVGVGGSGRKSLSTLAAYMAQYTLFQIEISKNYTITEWREDLKSVLRGAYLWWGLMGWRPGRFDDMYEWGIRVQI